MNLAAYGMALCVLVPVVALRTQPQSVAQSDKPMQIARSVEVIETPPPKPDGASYYDYEEREWYCTGRKYSYACPYGAIRKDGQMFIRGSEVK